MVASDQFKTDQLAKKIEERKEFLNRVVDRIIDLVKQYGRVAVRVQERWHTHVISELRNFGNFTFQTDLDQTDFGGNDVRVWYHPGKNFREGGLDFAFDIEWTPVLDVYFQAYRDYEVDKFNKGTVWQKALVELLRNQTRIVAQIRKAQDKTLKKQEQTETEKTKLIADAQKLGILPKS